MATDYLLLEDGVSKLILEDGAGDLILESSTGGTFAAEEEGWPMGASLAEPLVTVW